MKMSGKRFDPALRGQAVDMYVTGSSRAQVLDWVEAQCGRRPHPSSLSDWVAQARSRVAGPPVEGMWQFPAEVIGQVVASKLVLGQTNTAIAARFGCSTASVKAWVRDFGPDGGVDVSAAFDEVVLATMKRVSTYRSNKRNLHASANSTRTPTKPATPNSILSTVRRSHVKQAWKQISQRTPPSTPPSPQP